ncbi:hypothetical protein SCATT_p00220 (plasmid) [Streptantibioticus cattleyicolor NRRL 8057 = DSM 46488]|uniref:Uncharacterized protein n=1 Tax=Streptantibioticus cattleyicolor (strain ATCC 35852 / DSM 46488 / JCM 4925 / NBRC 14057 / NRRL 8057) TaxID=1003195 RepID=G8XDM1_STREN|nr:hypothetical protein SCATT_p00220 [Streptantibioticus cattleyicolor NRRL 8057 = DSM 46488]
MLLDRYIPYEYLVAGVATAADVVALEACEAAQAEDEGPRDRVGSSVGTVAAVSADRHPGRRARPAWRGNEVAVGDAVCRLSESGVAAVRGAGRAEPMPVERRPVRQCPVRA